MKLKLFKITTIAQQLFNHLPLIVVFLVALIITVQNINPNLHYSGWDNIMAELNFPRYVRQVFFGSWLEYQGLGAPPAQAHLSEIPRLPIIFLLKLLLPDNLVRYSYIFLMYWIGGLGMYLYLSQIWLNSKSSAIKNIKNWLASLGSVFYLLHLLTLQQYYIGFEMFMTQFAFFPFLLILVHQLAKKITPKNLLIFTGLQLLIASSGHTPTVYYLAVLFSLLYAFFVKLNHQPKELVKAFKFSFIIGLLTFFLNAYWMLPNLYYSFNNAHYVQESRTNTMFAPESVWSIKEAANLFSLSSGVHYLYNWKDYSFASQQFEFIFSEWQSHLSNPITQGMIYFTGLITFLGAGLVIFDKEQGSKRWAIFIFYLASICLIWIDLFPTKVIIDRLFENRTFMEAFRNPFTKLSILYSFVVVVLFIQAIESMINFLLTKIKSAQIKTYLIPVILYLLFFTVIYIGLPSFQGHFISEKLQVKYPQQYAEMYDYLQTRSANLRLLPMPQFSHAAWVYHDWGFIEPGNGYQGMGFNFFGIPQPVLERDFDRWVESNDFFYHELKYALDSRNVEHLIKIFEKYNVDLVLIDETKIDPFREINYQADRQMIEQAGLIKVWEKEFLTLYERKSPKSEEVILTPSRIKLVSANTDRVRRDYVYQHEADYILVDPSQAYVIYPFTDLTQTELNNIKFEADQVTITQEIEAGNYVMTLPGLKETTYLTPAEISYHEQLVTVKFPTQQIIVNNEVFELPKLNDVQFEAKDSRQEIIVFFNEQGIVLQLDKTVYPVIAVEIDQPLTVAYAVKPEALLFSESGKVPQSQLEIKEQLVQAPDWQLFKQDTAWNINNLESLQIRSIFPTVSLNLQQNPSVNCSDPVRGEITETILDNSVLYQADNYAVACNGYNFVEDLISPAYSYLVNIKGNNHQGRSIKFFVHYDDETMMPEDYTFPNELYDIFITLNQVSSNPKTRFFLNWETRSFGKSSLNQLDQIQVAPFALNQLAQLRLETGNTLEQINNEVEISSYHRLLESVYLLDYECLSEACYLGLDQSHDDLWLAIKVGEFNFLPHFRLNNWANLWQVKDSGQLVIFYLPELVSLFSLLFLVVWIAVVSKMSYWPKSK